MAFFIEGFQKLQQAGKVRHYGVSNSNFEYLKAFNADGKCSSLQIDYSILNRTAELDIPPYRQKNGRGVIVRGALAMGILADKFTTEIRFNEGDFRRRWLEEPEENRIFKEDLQKVEVLRPLEDERSLAQFVLANPAVSTVIPGGKNPAHAQANIQAGLITPLTARELTAVDLVVPPRW